MTKTEIQKLERKLKEWYKGWLAEQFPIYVPLLVVDAAIEPKGSGQAYCVATCPNGHTIRTQVLYSDEGVTLIDNPVVVLDRE